MNQEAPVLEKWQDDSSRKVKEQVNFFTLDEMGIGGLFY